MASTISEQFSSIASGCGSPPVVWASREDVPARLKPQLCPQRQNVVVIGGLTDMTSVVKRLEGRFSVRLPTQGIEVVDGVAFFAVEVFPDSTSVTPWRVMRRYTEFRQLARNVASDKSWRRHAQSTETIRGLPSGAEADTCLRTKLQWSSGLA